MKFKGSFVDRTAAWGLVICVLFFIAAMISSLH
jgi:hypothetical protein